MIHPEKNTIDAINKLKDDYPYAASLLVYVVIERQLKEYILKNRNQIDNFKKNITESDNEFIKNVITKLTLEKVEKRLEITRGPAKDRSDLMHSNLYLLKEKDLPDCERHNKNIQYFEKAKAHLIRIFKDYSDILIVEKEGQLVFKS